LFTLNLTYSGVCGDRPDDGKCTRRRIDDICETRRVIDGAMTD